MKDLPLRTKSRRQQNLVRLALAGALLVIYAVLVMVFGLGHAGCFWGVAQMRVFLPTLVLFGILAYETRWDGTVRVEEDADDEAKEQVEDGRWEVQQRRVENSIVQPSTSNLQPISQPQPISQSQPPSSIVQLPTFTLHPSSSTSPLTPEEAWEAARALPHNVVPDPVMERDYYALVVQAATGGHLEALLKLSDYARQRGANVEAYYWAAVAQKRGAKGLDGRLGEIRKQWLLAEADGEYENVYEFFPETSGTIARSLLRIACSIDAPYARKRLRELASFGDANAKLFC